MTSFNQARYATLAQVQCIPGSSRSTTTLPRKCEGLTSYSFRPLLTQSHFQNGWTQFISMQNQYSLIYREEEREMIAYCKFAGIGLIPWGPLSHGQLARPISTQTPRGESMKGTPFAPEPREWEIEIIRRVEKIANEKGWSMAQVCLAWIHEKVTSPIIGFSSVSTLCL
jgi:aryl-alcohol dehydrogenase-like predicted oxidoreductase